MNQPTGRYLAHYGVKGMKWGVRRTPEQLGHKIRAKLRFKSKSKAPPKAVPKPQTQHKPSIKDMSDEDLRKAIGRIEMERKYAQLTAPQVSKGRKFVTDVLYNSAKATATTYTTKAMTKAVESLLTDRKGSKP